MGLTLLWKWSGSPQECDGTPLQSQHLGRQRQARPPVSGQPELHNERPCLLKRGRGVKLYEYQMSLVLKQVSFWFIISKCSFAYLSYIYLYTPSYGNIFQAKSCLEQKTIKKFHCTKWEGDTATARWPEGCVEGAWHGSWGPRHGRRASVSAGYTAVWGRTRRSCPLCWFLLYCHDQTAWPK